MAFKPISKEETINGVKCIAQFNGVSAMLEATNDADGDSKKMVEYLFKNVLIEPKIDDMDEFFGTDVDFMNEVVSFASAVMRADEKYFPKTNKESASSKGTK